MYIREQTYHGLGESIGPFEGTFTGTIRGDKDSAATIQIVLTDRDNVVTGRITLSKGLKLDLGGFCLMEDVDLSSINISGRTSPDNPRYFHTSMRVTESPVNTPTVKSADINVTIKATLSSDGTAIAAEVTFDPLEGVISILGVESKADLKKKGCRAKTLPVTLHKQPLTGSLKGYIYDPPFAVPFLRPEQPGILRPFQNYYYLNCIPSSQRISGVGSRSELGLGGVSGIRFARVEQQGAVIHSGTLGTGKVEVRSGERLEIEEMRNGTPTGRTPIVPGFLALEYNGDQAAVTRWLQFGWFELTANIPGVANRAVFPGSLPSIGGSPRPFTTDMTKPQWFVDSASPVDPFYDSAGLAHRSQKSMTIFDRPGVLIEKTVPTVFQQAKTKSGVKADSVTFAAHFDSYLIQNNAAVYHVPWVATIKFSYSERTQQKPPIYAIEGAAGPVTTLPEFQRTLLHSVYTSHMNIR